MFNHLWSKNEIISLFEVLQRWTDNLGSKIGSSFLLRKIKKGSPFSHLSLLEVMTDFFHKRTVVSPLNNKFFVFKAEAATGRLTFPVLCRVCKVITNSPSTLLHKSHNLFLILMRVLSPIDRNIHLKSLLLNSSDLSEWLKPGAPHNRVSLHCLSWTDVCCKQKVSGNNPK